MVAVGDNLIALEVVTRCSCVLQGFYCDTQDEFDNLCRNIRRHFMTSDTQTPMFEVHEHKLPVHISSETTQLGLYL